MRTIKVDDEVYSFLQEHAEPFLDSPNTVLRKLLLKDSNATGREDMSEGSAKQAALCSTEADTFVQDYLQSRFDEEFHLRRPFRTMYQSGSRMAYVLTFNKSNSPNLWYRIPENALRTLFSHRGDAYVVFAVPPDGYVFEIPIDELRSRSGHLSKGSIEVNIDPKNARWREFDWNLQPYKVMLSSAA